MNSLPEILDISSDDEQGFPETGGGDGDDCDWLARLLIDAADDKQNLPEDDSDEVVVVGEFINDMRNSNSRESTAMLRDFDDDCVVLDGDPNNSVSEVNDDDTADNGSDECLIVGGKGQIACRDYPHPRHLCAIYPFSSTPHDKHCDQCHCYVCESVVPCLHWGTGISNNDHCHATDKEEIWKFQRKCFKLGINAQALMCPDSPLSVALPQCNQPQPLDSFPFPSNSMPPNQVSRPSTIRPCTTVNNYTVPNVISQGRSQQPASILPKNRVHPHLISQQLRGVHQRDRAVSHGNLGPRLTSTVFKKGSVGGASPMPRNVYVSGSAINNNCVRAAQHARIATSTTLSNERNPIRWQNVCPSVKNLEACRPRDSSQPNLGSFVGNIIPSQQQMYNQPIAQSNDGQNFYQHGYQSQNASKDIYQNGNCLNDRQNIIQHGNQSQSVSDPGSVDFNISWPYNSAQCDQQPPIGNVQVQSGGYIYEPTPVEDSNSQFMRSAPFSQNSRPESIGSANLSPSNQEVPIENSILQSTEPTNEPYPINLSSVDLEFDWLGGSILSEPIFSPGPSSIDPGMLSFDFETSWNSAHA
uniref:Uncharacterized protein n=1 Tax=Fagus sylvatica TaxID=28930 RepID=A0A2N9HJY3_FAGSY